MYDLQQPPLETPVPAPQTLGSGLGQVLADCAQQAGDMLLTILDEGLSKCVGAIKGIGSGGLSLGGGALVASQMGSSGAPTVSAPAVSAPAVSAPAVTPPMPEKVLNLAKMSVPESSAILAGMSGSVQEAYHQDLGGLASPQTPAVGLELVRSMQQQSQAGMALGG